MGLIGLPWSSRVELEGGLRFSGSACSSFMVGNTCGNMRRVGFAIEAGFKHDESKMSRRVVLNLVIGNIGFNSAQMLVFDMKSTHVSPSSLSNGVVRYTLTSFQPSSNYSYVFVPIFFVK
ncbi:hypothetical protein Hanom_Chr05g00388001 [Helianthus anomalus]